MKLIRKIFITTLASAGIRIDKLTNSRIDSLLLIFIGYGSHIWISQYISFNVAIFYFVILFAIRYIFLFTGFGKKGFVNRLVTKFGEEKAWNKYELFTSIMFFQRGLSFGLLTQATKWSIIPVVHFIFPSFNIDVIYLKYTCELIGLILIIIGTWVNITATFVIGIDTYYYKDLFLKRPLVDFKIEGPYKYFSNPMYGIGQLNAYGAALILGSVEGILGALLNQVMMYIFYFVIEKPHIIQNILPKKSKPALSMA
ncbi:phosphatidylethanolamine N-methyltransferase family protein [Ferruginibacter albus]|uniref:phosphatidylethanolamine N-methyltransferase family protein n=1 Tax=Ferruginibacter albus TaxID=2875540 RepID=UPI001CC6B48B|nr:phosphatidylethanolamine N-methyltransferase family protein [Ferruginibacter albus]UAY51235.1 phosphatidylethanolamine N-methyltransferase family protein [Ferruginibacter albus]